VPQFLRVLQQQRWMDLQHDWLGEDEIPADPVGDLRTTDNKMSVWMLAEESLNLPRIVSALGANRDKLDKLDLALLDSDELSAIGIQTRQSEGDSADEMLNRSFHYDLVEISADKLVNLAKAIIRANRFERVQREDVKRYIACAVKNGWVQEDALRLKSDEIKKVRQFLDTDNAQGGTHD